MRVLALQLKRIGDLVLTTPALRALKAGGAHVTLALTEGTAALLPLLNGLVDEPLIYRARGGGGAFWRRVLRGGFEASVDFTGTDRSALLTLAARARRRVGADAHLRRRGWRQLCYNAVAVAPVRSRHTVDHYLDHLAPLGLPPTAYAGDPIPALRLPPAAVARADEVLSAHGLGPGEPFVVVHPGSARADKYWLPERWAEVIAYCQKELGQRCVLTGGRGDPYEDAHLAQIRTALAAHGQTCPDLAGQLDLAAFAAVLARCRLFCGVDSGPAHLAAANLLSPPPPLVIGHWSLVIPPRLLILFGPTNPFHWRPRRPGARVLRAGHGDAPLTDFVERSPGGPLDLVSTQAVTRCIKELLASDAPRCPPTP